MHWGHWCTNGIMTRLVWLAQLGMHSGLSDAGRISLAASETYSRTGQYKVNSTRSSITSHHTCPPGQCSTPSIHRLKNLNWHTQLAIKHNRLCLGSWASALTVASHQPLCPQSPWRRTENRTDILCICRSFTGHHTLDIQTQLSDPLQNDILSCDTI